MKICTNCHKENTASNMSQSRGAAAGWCLRCADALRPRHTCVKCRKEKPYDAMSRSKVATVGWCLDCVDANPDARYSPAKRDNRRDNRDPLPPHKMVEFRARYGLGQSGLAQALGCSVPAISSWENGHTAIPRYIQLAMSAFVAGLPPYAG